MSSSVGMMTFPTEWNHNPNVPNHQPVNMIFADSGNQIFWEILLRTEWVIFL
jgi:hypothetical protein